MKNNKKVSYLLIIIALLVIGGFVYYFSQKSAETGIQTPSISQAGEWKTYTNTQFKFSFQYPSNWSVCKKANDTELVAISDNCNSAKEISSYPTNSFLVRNIGDLDLNYLESGSLKPDTGWNNTQIDQTTFVQMRALYYQPQNINLILVGNSSTTQSILNDIALTFKFN